LGGEGYLGWPTALHFSARNHDVLMVDNFVKRKWERSCGARPLQPIARIEQRIKHWHATGRSDRPIRFKFCDISRHYEELRRLLEDFEPDTIIHYAEQPSAPFSMRSQKIAGETQRNNILGTLNLIFAIREACPEAHIVKLGTMGEYGTPNIDIEEGWLEVEHNGRRDRMLYPKRPGSFYHLSKVHDSANLEFACRIWDLRVTDLNQGVVYGMFTDEISAGSGLHTSFHYDSTFGTVLNRFIVQALSGVPLTVYGSGQQTRGFLNIRDTLGCVELATLSPARPGEFRVFNQFTEQFTVLQLATAVVKAARSLGCRVTVGRIDNPRVELDNHYYNAKHQALMDLGLQPHLLSEEVLVEMLEAVARETETIDRACILPTVRWRSTDTDFVPPVIERYPELSHRGVSLVRQ
jgi:UDP-sulfoquinovose synthase